MLKRLTKRIALFAALWPVLPLIAVARLGLTLGSRSPFLSCACLLALIPGRLGSTLRLAYYRGTLLRISPDVAVGFGTFFTKADAEVGHNVCIGAYCILGCVTLGDDVLLGSRVSIPSGGRQHLTRYEETDAPDELRFDRVTIGNGCWIGEGAIVLADVGERSVVSAGSVVMRPMPGGRLISGNPARPFKDLGAASAQRANEPTS